MDCEGTANKEKDTKTNITKMFGRLKSNRQDRRESRWFSNIKQLEAVLKKQGTGYSSVSQPPGRGPVRGTLGSVIDN
jgi:hypothetical protein